MSQLTAHDPTPDVEVALIDEFERFLSRLPAFDRKVLELKLQGHTTAEIADSVGSYERKIRRVLERAAALAQGSEAAEAEE